MRAVRFRAAAIALGTSFASAVAAAPGDRLSFVSCPIVRDTRTVPCWLSEYEGVLYYLTIQSDVSAEVQPPMLGHQVLVEGIVSDAPPICGGIVLDSVRLSVMPEREADCNVLLPADERYTVDFNPRPPGPSAGRLAFAPDPSAPPPSPRAGARGSAPAPQGPQTFDLYFDFDKGISFRHPGALVSILQAADRREARRVRITGVRGAHRLSDGTLLEESPTIGQRRAEEVQRLLAGAGLNATTAVEWIDGRADADGVDDWQSRRVTVVVAP
jgi:hypothetical protein